MNLNSGTLNNTQYNESKRTELNLQSILSSFETTDLENNPK